MSVNSRKKRFVNPIKIGVTRRARIETIWGKAPAIFNGHQPPRADDPYMYIYIWYVSKLGSNLWPQPKKKIFCGGHCVKSIYPREKVKYVPNR